MRIAASRLQPVSSHKLLHLAENSTALQTEHKERQKALAPLV